MAKRKLIKKIEDNKLTISVVGIEGSNTYDPTKLPEDIQAQLPCIALNHILGDSAAGKAGADAEKCIAEKWKAMMEGKMTTRKPKEPSVKETDLLENFKKLTPKQKTAAKGLMESLGLDVSAFM
jgi:hypothetical protein